MTLIELRRTIEGHAPGSMIPRDWLLDQLGEASGDPAGVETWVDIFRASEVTGETVQFLRARALHWRGMPSPEVRVTKNDPDTIRSPWLFSEEDCWSYATKRDRSGPPLAADPTVDPDDDESVMDHWSSRATANL